VANRIREKASRQLPRLSPGILVIDPPWDLWDFKQARLAEWVGSLLPAHPHLNALVLYQNRISSEPVEDVTVPVPGGILIIQQRDLICCEQCLVLWNSARIHSAGDMLVATLLGF